VCNRRDWCAFSGDGRFIWCTRSEEWSGVRAILHGNPGWLFSLAPNEVRPPIPRESAPRPELPSRADLDRVYRRAAELLGVADAVRDELVIRRKFFPAFQGPTPYFSLPRTFAESLKVSDQLVSEFGGELVERVPGFLSVCTTCNGRGISRGVACRPCRGLGKHAPRLMSGRKDQHDFGIGGCDEDGLVFWVSVRRLPIDEESEDSKYILFASGRGSDPSVAGQPKYHVAGMRFSPDLVFVTEGVTKAEITAWRQRVRCIGLYSTSVDDATEAEVVRLARNWQPCS